MEAFEVCELSDFAKDGAWPVGGGTLDQSDSFLTAHRLIQATQFKLLNPTPKL